MSTIPEDSPKPRRSNLRRLLIISAIALFACMACGLISLFLPDTGTEPATESETQVAEIVIEETQEPTPEPAQPQPTVEPSPLPTEPPTAVPLTAIPPTDIPPPTATAEIDEDAAAELLYRTEATEILDLYYTSIQGVSTQSSAVATDISLLRTSEWKVRTAVYLAGLTMAGESLRELEPPTDLAEVHTALLEATGYFDMVVTNYSQGVDELNADKLNLAAANIELGSIAMNRAAELLGDINTSSIVPLPTQGPINGGAQVAQAMTLDELKAALDNALGESNRGLGRKLDYFDSGLSQNSIIVGWAADGAESNALIRDGLERDTLLVLQTIAASGINFDDVSIGSKYLITLEQFNITDEVEVLTLTYHRDTLAAFDWDNVTSDEVFELADLFIINPMFEE